MDSLNDGSSKFPTLSLLSIRLVCIGTADEISFTIRNPLDVEKCQADKRKNNPDPVLVPVVSHLYMCQRQEQQLSIDHQICRILYIRNENHSKTVSDKTDELTCWHSLRLKANQLQKYTNEMKMNPRSITHDQPTITAVRTRSVNRFLPVSDGNYSKGYYVRGVHRSLLLACNVQSSAMVSRFDFLLELYTIEKKFSSLLYSNLPIINYAHKLKEKQNEFS
ncbi:hypothetical protein T4A_4093 [Trichinella pseudospiralis]|uniref:Uncharacterized protein n=1 Tax=Trichinella pseudospiralis TaxID=6337 RepID=A0A0V1E1A9_TRIPS|nr:hypothetical protein T4A_4093 [Trichinella pseudospiralis]